MKTFFLVGGVVLVLTGVLQAIVRPRRENETGLQRVLNASVLRAVLFVAVGIGAILLGAGRFPLPGAP